MEDRNAMPTEAMVEAACKERYVRWELLPEAEKNQARLKMRRWIVAALAQVREIAIKPLDWQDAKDRGYSQAYCALGQYQVCWLGEFECWQCFRPHRSGLDWKDNFSRHASKEEAKAAAQRDFERRIRSALALPLPVQEKGDNE